jgi:hypothetical protein
LPIGHKRAKGSLVGKHIPEKTFLIIGLIEAPNSSSIISMQPGRINVHAKKMPAKGEHLFGRTGVILVMN